MKPTDFFRWWILDEATGRRRRTRYRLTRDEAVSRHPGAEPDLATREVRSLPETVAEHQLNGSWLRKGPKPSE